MKSLIIAIVSGLVVALLSKALDIYGLITVMKSIYQTYIVELWPMWIGLLTFMLVWLVNDYIKLRRFVNRLEKWIGLFSWKDNYYDLKGKIYYYIKDELEKNKM